MLSEIGTRELFVLDGPDGLIRGTFHKTRNDCAGLVERDRVGVVFLNGLPATRAAHGNAAVYWADSFAERGYPSFRLDLPGFGDSDGDPPAEWLRFINTGGYAPVASDAIGAIAERFKLDQVVVVGHCAGAVSAVYTAALNRACKGLVLIDPYFYSAQTERPKTRQQLSRWAEHSHLGGFLRGAFGGMKKTCLALFSNVYPDHANVPLLRCWKELASAGLPILILKAPGKWISGRKPRAGEFDYFEYVLGLAGRKNQVAATSIEGANHTFSNRAGRAAVRRRTEEWLSGYFPIAESKGCNGSIACETVSGSNLTAEAAGRA